MSSNTGMLLEKEVYALVQSLMDKGKLPFRKEVCKLRRNAQYFSPQRNSVVNFENVLEVYMDEDCKKRNDQPVIVVFFECKDYGRPVEVGKVDELVGRLNHSFGFAKKAFLVTRNSFSSGALSTAKSHGIGLLRILPQEQIEFESIAYCFNSMEDYINFQREKFIDAAKTALKEENFTSYGPSCFGAIGDQVLSSLEDMMNSTFVDHKILPVLLP